MVLCRFAYDAELAGLKYSLSSSKSSMLLAIDGYHEKQGVLLKKIANLMINMVVDTKRFEVLKEARIRALKNFQMEQPHSHASYWVRVMLSSKVWTFDEILAAAVEDDLSVEALQAFIPQLFAKIYVQGLIFGNVTRERAIDLMDIVQKELGTRCLPINRYFLQSMRQVILPLGPGRCVNLRQRYAFDSLLFTFFFSFMEVSNKVHKSSCIKVLFQVGPDEAVSNMSLQLFAQIINEPCFDILRTKEQLGYIVFSSASVIDSIHGLQVTIQSTHRPPYLNSRIEDFFVKARSIIEV